MKTSAISQIEECRRHEHLDAEEKESVRRFWTTQWLLVVILLSSLVLGGLALFLDRPYYDPTGLNGPGIVNTCSRLFNLMTREQNHEMEGSWGAKHCDEQLSEGIAEISVTGAVAVGSFAMLILIPVRRGRSNIHRAQDAGPATA